jgi:carbon-monoxide dehydrogenase medium subunit
LIVGPTDEEPDYTQECRELTAALGLEEAVRFLGKVDMREHYPALADACHVVANIRIRNMATIGGNLAHADYQSDPPTMLAALNTRVELMSARGVRTLPLGEFQLGSYDTELQPGELLSAITIPP